MWRCPPALRNRVIVNRAEGAVLSLKSRVLNISRYRQIVCVVRYSSVTMEKETHAMSV